MRVLCISGKRFAGKDTLARHLVEAAGHHHTALATYAFAGECKQMFAAARPEVELARFAERAYKETWRPELTRFTVEQLAADPLVFVREVMRRIAASSGAALITDLRLRHELEHLRSTCEPHVLRVVRSDAHRAAAGWVFDPDKDGHHTETELDDPSLWDEVVPNDGSEAELAARAEQVISRWLGRSAAPRSGH